MRTGGALTTTQGDPSPRPHDAGHDHDHDDTTSNWRQT
jgi:hypothetical protein